ncbi:MAG: HAD family hydrolase [Candidatus Cyclobacteriaceae bacterium M3_2C_046]
MIFASKKNIPVLIEPNIKTIIFDLGGVILNIDPLRTLQAFAQLVHQSPTQVQELIHKDRAILLEYEVGHIDDQEFIQRLHSSTGYQISHDDFIRAWNQVLIAIPPDRIELLKQLRHRYQLIMLSNTNHLHKIRFHQILQQTTGYQNFDQLFHKVYLSHEIHLRKPDPAIYQYVLDKNQLEPAQTLMLDDLPENLEGAQSVGIKTRLIQRNNPNFDFFDHE